MLWLGQGRGGDGREAAPFAMTTKSCPSTGHVIEQDSHPGAGDAGEELRSLC